MSTINVNYMTRTYNQFQKNQKVRTTSDKSMANTIADKLAGNEKTEGVGSTAKTEAVSTKDMTMEEYKQYIHDKISEIPMHPSRMQETISINISEAGFEAMKNDPDYEAWVLNDLRTGWAQPDRWAGTCGGAYSTIYYGATKEECHAEMWSAGYQNGNGKSLHESKSKDSFWERKVEREKRLQAQAEERQEKKRLEKAAYEKAVMEEKFAHQRLLAGYEKEALLQESGAVSSNMGSAMTSSMAAASYEANFLMTDNNLY